MALTSVEREPGQLRSASTGFRFVLLCILAIALMVLDHQNQHLVQLRTALSVLLYPVEALVSAPSELRRNFSESVATRAALIDENRRLKERELIVNARLQTMAALEAENARLRALLDSTEKVGNDILIAEIVSVDMNPFRNMIVVNKGGNDGAYVGQALIDADGIVGQITRDRHFSSEAMLVTDVDHATPVELARNRLRTVATGTGELDKLSLPFLPVSADIQEGDLLVSSGLGGTFPPGYPVGVVRKVTRITGQPFLQVIAEPAAALNRIREVLLVTPQNRDPEGLTAEDSDPNILATDPAPVEPAAATAQPEPAESESVPEEPATPAADGAAEDAT
ncbi:MAG: rod shape-determining protein MreC [Chromatiales bacterium]|jgi:rod shape-determining protein MreC